MALLVIVGLASSVGFVALCVWLVLFVGTNKRSERRDKEGTEQ